MRNPHRRLKPRVVVIGGGYAGLTAAVELARTRRFEIVLVDRHAAYLDQVQLHRTVHTPLAELQTDYRRVLDPWGIEFRQSELDLSGRALVDWETAGALPVDGEHFSFDYLVVASGGRTRLPGPLAGRVGGPDTVTLEELKVQGARGWIQRFLETTPPVERVLSIVGGGATGVQFLFELDDHLRLHRERCLINFIHHEERLLTAFPESFGDYAAGKLRSRNGTIEYYPGTRFLGQRDGRVILHRQGQKISTESRLTLLFTGVEPAPHIQTTPTGQAICDGKLMPRVFAAGDCADFAGGGLNSLSAQAAVRKAKTVAENVLRHATGRELQDYSYRELGYFVSLGSGDGVGWMLRKRGTLTGLPAFAVKNAIEAQWSLFLQGVDTYIDL